MQQKQTQKARAITPELRRRLLILGAKIIGIILVIYILLFRIYGLTRIDTNVMAPSVKGGDLALIFRPVGELSVGDVVSYRCGDRACTGRIAAKAGDAVDVNEEGKIIINGHAEDIASYGDVIFPQNSTMTYPYTVAENQYFILGDNRSEYDDSRTYGSIDKEAIIGQVIGVFRTNAI